MTAGTCQGRLRRGSGDTEHWSQGSAEAHRMATGPPLGRRGDAESIEGNRFISPTHTGGA
jgi:hypothetical protein